jgi:hypothetical protein
MKRQSYRKIVDCIADPVRDLCTLLHVVGFIHHVVRHNLLGNVFSAF